MGSKGNFGGTYTYEAYNGWFETKYTHGKGDFDTKQRWYAGRADHSQTPWRLRYFGFAFEADSSRVGEEKRLTDARVKAYTDDARTGAKTGGGSTGTVTIKANELLRMGSNWH